MDRAIYWTVGLGGDPFPKDPPLGHRFLMECARSVI